MMIGESDIQHMQRLARKAARNVDDDRTEMARDLESAGWIEVLKQRREGRRFIWWRYVIYAHQSEVVKWCFGISQSALCERPRERPRLHQLDHGEIELGGSINPERLLVLYEEMKEAVKKDVRRRLTEDPERKAWRLQRQREGGLNNGQSKKTHCPRNHPLSGENVRLVKRTDGRIFRRCMACRRVNA